MRRVSEEGLDVCVSKEPAGSTAVCRRQSVQSQCPQQDAHRREPGPKLSSSDKRRLRSSVLKRSRLQVHWKSACHKSPPCRQRHTQGTSQQRALCHYRFVICALRFPHLPAGGLVSWLTPAAWMADGPPGLRTSCPGPAWGKCVKVSFCLRPLSAKV